MSKVPRQKKVAFFDGSSGDMECVHSGLFWYCTWNDKQFRHLQYCLMDRKKCCLLQELSMLVSTYTFGFGEMATSSNTTGCPRTRAALLLIAHGHVEVRGNAKVG